MTRRLFSPLPSSLVPAEPATTLTDLFLAAQTFSYAARLRKGPAWAHKSGRLWALAFVAAGIAALAGAVVHALTEERTPRLRGGLWKIVGLATSVGSAAMLAAGALAALRKPYRGALLAFAAVKFVIASVATWRLGDFLYIIVDYAASMVILLALQARQWRRSPAASWLTGGVLVSFLAAGIQQSGLTLHKHFNYNDLYHVVQMGGFHLLYAGAKRISDREG